MGERRERGKERERDKGTLKHRIQVLCNCERKPPQERERETTRKTGREKGHPVQKGREGGWERKGDTVEREGVHLLLEVPPLFLVHQHQVDIVTD